MCIIFIAYNIKHDYNENSFIVSVNKVSISEATVRVSLYFVQRICSIVHHLGLFNTLRTGSFKLFKRLFPEFLTILTP